MITKTKIVLASLLLLVANAIPVLYYLWATYVAQITWDSWAGFSFFIIIIGPLACFFAVATIAYWWEIAAHKHFKYHLYPLTCIILAAVPIMVYLYIWAAN
jgi:hypothetical protein